MANYFRRALERRNDVELFTVGEFFGQYIPWNGGMTIPMKYPNQVDLPLPQGMTSVSWSMIEGRLPWKPDLIINVDAGFHFSSKPDVPYAVVATDPHCVSGDTLLATDAGILYANEAAHSKITKVANASYTGYCKGVVYKGVIPTRKLTLDTGQILSCTDDHEVETPAGFVESRYLKVGDKVITSRGTYTSIRDGDDKDYSIGFIIGAFLGDGSFGSGDMIKFTIAKKEKETFGKSIRQHLLNGFGVDVVTDTPHYTSDNAKVLQVRRWGLHRFLKSLDLKSGKIPLYIRTSTKSMIGGFIAGLLAADGCSVDGIIQITSKWETLIRELQIILGYFGIYSKIKSHIGGLTCFKPGSVYWDLYVVAGDSHENLVTLTGDIPGRHIRMGSRGLKGNRSLTREVTIVDIEGAVRNSPSSRVGEPVYDVMASESSSFLANGISVHNCLGDWYAKVRPLADKFFNMQPAYMQDGDVLLPYAFDQNCHYPVDTVSIPKVYDCSIIGLHYPQRDAWVAKLRGHGVKVNYRIGDIYDEYREENNKAWIGLNWSSLEDVTARVFEIMAMRLVPVLNRLPGLSALGLEEGRHYLGFSDLNEATEKVLWAINNREFAEQIALEAYQYVHTHDFTYDNRIRQILCTMGF